MRELYHEQLEQLQEKIRQMGALCEEAVCSAVHALANGDTGLLKKAARAEWEIDLLARDVETLCVTLLWRQTPVAGEMRQVTAAMRMVADLERIGDQAADIAEIIPHLSDGHPMGETHLYDMAVAALSMVSRSLAAYLQGDIGLARSVMAEDDRVDAFFLKVREELIRLVKRRDADGGKCFDLFAICKYLERIADHACNVAEWALYSQTGEQVPTDPEPQTGGE